MQGFMSLESSGGVVVSSERGLTEASYGAKN